MTEVSESQIGDEDDNNDKDFDLPSELVDHPESEVKVPDTNRQGK